MSVPFALSLSKYVNSAGTDIGFASLLAVALLAVLYFAGARESRTLREELEDAQERLADLEAHITQLLRQRPRSPEPAPAVAGASAPRAGVVPAPALSGRTAGAGARVQREGTGVGAAGLAGAPAGAGAPALGSATTLIPGPTTAPVRSQPAAVPASNGTTVAGRPLGPGGLDADSEEFDELGPEDTMFVPAAGNGGTRRGGGAVPVGLGDDDDVVLGPPPRRTGPTVSPEPSPVRHLAVRVLGAVAALVVVGIIVAGLLAITSSGSSSSNVTTIGQSGASTSVHRTTHTTTTPFNPALVKVSVLNGTAVSGLAGDVARELTSVGYTVPASAVTNAAVQTATTTTVGYRPGLRADALRVAAALSKASGVTIDTVQPATSSAITSCATPTGSGQAGSCPAGVIVTVGSDLSSVATSTTSG